MNIYQLKSEDIYNDTKIISNHYYPDISISKIYSEHELESIKPYRFPIIKIINEDSLDEYVNTLKEGYFPVLLNSSYSDNLYTRTNYFMVTSKYICPVHDTDTLYSKDVVLFKSNKKYNYSLIDPISINVIMCSNNQHIDLEIQYKKICSIFKTAILNRHDAIILNIFCNHDILKLAIDEYGHYFKKIVFII